MIEKKTNIYEGNKRALIATVLLVVMLLSASYAFFSNFNAANAVYNATIGNMANITMAFNNTSNIDYTIDPVEMQGICDSEGGSSYDSSATSNHSGGEMVITATNASGIDDVTCKYEIWYNPVNPFKNSSANTSNKMEWQLVGNASDNTQTFAMDIGGITKPTKVYEGTIVFSEETTNYSLTWAPTIKHYIYCNGFDQSEQMGRNYKGFLQIKSAGCEDKTPTFSEMILAKESASDYTSSQDGTIYKIAHETVEYNGRILDAGVRYEGKDPDNYITFNGESAGWRIIGVFEGSTIGLEPGKQYTKIIKSNWVVGMMPQWDCDNYIEPDGENGLDCPVCEGTYENDWENSTLKAYLNGQYLNTISESSKIAKYNGNYSTWYLRGLDTTSHNNAYTQDWYLGERITGKPGYKDGVQYGAKAEIKAAIGLMYPSDYGYAAYGTECNNKTTSPLSAYGDMDWDTYEKIGCGAVNWLSYNGRDWSISPAPNSANGVYVILNTDGGIVGTHGADGSPNFDLDALPTLYLDASLDLGSGTGSKTNPYVLK